VTAETCAEAAMSDARDKATEASRLKSDFLANMSHEIRTPMNGVIGMTDLLLETDLDIRQRDYAQTVRNSGEALLTIINDILDFSKIEAGMLEMESIEFSVQAIVDDVVALLAGSAKAKGLELLAAIESSIPAVVIGDPGRVRQILTNLIANAVKFTQTGEIVVRVSEVGVVGPDTVVRFEVSDSGDGIDPDKLDVIFQPFVQADTSTSRKYGGTGLGLAISVQLVALMGGDCGVSSQLGEGSNFWFTIRARAELGQENGSTATEVVEVVATDVTAARPVQVGEGRLGRLLLAEDNAINQKVAVAILSNAGYTVDTVVNGEAAVTAVLSQPYDAILMDCQMPVMNGYEATAAIRAQGGSAGLTPIIAMTAGARREDQVRCLAEGMDSYLSKPVSKDALLALVSRSVSKSRR
jgi:CheY-like chemotaxis protein